MAESTPPPSFEQAREVSQTCAAFNLRKAMRAVSQLYDDALRPIGLRGTQFTLLTAIRLMQPATVNEIAASLGMDRTTLTRNLRPLEREGLIRISEGADRRVREITLTKEGGARLGRAYPLWKEVQEKIVGGLGVERFAHLVDELSATAEVAS